MFYTIIEMVVSLFTTATPETLEESITLWYVPASQVHGSHTEPSNVCDCYYSLVA